MPPELVDAVEPLRRRLSMLQRAGTRIGFVPTMGALHSGHASLIDRARAECEGVVVSIFVNPLQFDRHDDLERYPRTIDADLALCQSRGVDIVFVPSTAEMYPRPQACTVDPGFLAEHCCGRYRPGHFEGVATVVLKLLEIVRPDVAYFGEKDAQQLTVVRRLVQDFNVPVTIVGVPTVRDADGLAVSSRNKHLDPEERRLAPSLYRALTAAASCVDAGLTDTEAIKARAIASIPEDDRLRLEYLDVVNPADFQPVPRVTGTVIIAGALWVGRTRLIDNVVVKERRQAVPVDTERRQAVPVDTERRQAVPEDAESR